MTVNLKMLEWLRQNKVFCEENDQHFSFFKKTEDRRQMNREIQ